MGWDCVFSTASAVRCTLDSGSIDVVTVLIQGLFVIAGLLFGVGLSLIVASYLGKL